MSDKSLSSVYQILGKVFSFYKMSMFVCLSCQGVGTERLLVKGKKEEVLTVDGDQFRYFLLAGGIEFVFVCIFRLILRLVHQIFLPCRWN